MGFSLIIIVCTSLLTTVLTLGGIFLYIKYGISIQRISMDVEYVEKAEESLPFIIRPSSDSKH